MTALRLDRTATTPDVLLDPQGLLIIRGECYPENPAVLFGQLLEALERTLSQPGLAILTVTIRLGYVNSASTKGLRKLFHRLDRAAEGGVTVELTWEHEATDDTMADLGRDLAEDLHFLQLSTRAFVVRAA